MVDIDVGDKDTEEEEKKLQFRRPVWVSLLHKASRKRKVESRVERETMQPVKNLDLYIQRNIMGSSLVAKTVLLLIIVVNPSGKLKPSQCLSLVTAYLILPTPPPPRASPGGVLSPTRCNTIVSTRRRLVPVRAIDSDLPHPIKEYEEWDSWTAKFSGGANVRFLMMQLPQIILNAQNLLAGNNTALSAVPSGMLTGLLGNLSLLSYSAKKREKEAAVVQTLGVISTLQWLELCLCNILLLLPPVVMVGLVLNCLFYFGKFGITVWRLWEDFITVGGLSVLPQIMWSTFVPLVPNNILPGASVFVIAVAAVIMVSFQALLLQFLFSP
ncbi:hypothetical protein F2Q70_00014433 [Brassica cretica]|uniref:Uncharacterized protein n=1 Tax=Brassica cretica TaxID=69181 RepID=A0A8S9I2M5_BRACR|nr:hypothetical protein F2Q70_00014433 [Brassica cretica]